MFTNEGFIVIFFTSSELTIVNLSFILYKV